MLTAYSKPFRKTHDISDLSEDCLEIDASLEPIVSRAERLTQYAWRFRYPGAPFEPGAADAAEGIETARMALTEVEILVKGAR